MKNTIGDLRNHLFETLEHLKDEEKPMELERAAAIVNVANSIIESAKVEVKFLEAIDSADTSEFFDLRRIEKRRSLAGAVAPEPTQRRLTGSR